MISGSKNTEETKQKISKSLRGRTFSKDWKEKIILAKRGKRRSEETKKKISKKLKGRKLPKETRIKMSLAHKGSKSHLWKGGITELNSIIRNSPKYRDWRLEVLAKDFYTCQGCLGRGGKLETHHIENFSSNRKLRFETSNGITLCYVCHKKFHKEYGRKDNNLEQILEFITCSTSEKKKS